DTRPWLLLRSVTLLTNMGLCCVAAVCGLLYLYARYQYFQGYRLSAHGRLGPMYFSAKVLWILIGLSIAGLLGHFLSLNSFVGRMEIPSKLQLLFQW
uniref:Leukotriene C4 synthase n=1 Tax=Chelonoidis abingdonii TaxID=106734 RepID=A0A8C0HEZ1_CHEAB